MAGQVENQRERLETFSQSGLFRALSSAHQSFIMDAAEDFRLTHQEFLQLTEITSDLAMWGGFSPVEIWQEETRKHTQKDTRQRKKRIMKGVRQRWEGLKARGPIYGPAAQTPVRPRKRKLTVLESDHTVLGWCPVASERTVCCNLRTLDAVQGCGMGCSYCSIQTFYDERKVAVDTKLADKLAKIQLDPSRRYHIGSGQSSDSLLLGDRHGILSAQLEFARRNPNVVFEFKTKSKQIDRFLQAGIPKNILLCWSLNTQPVIDAEEHGTASLEERLATARKAADHGIRVGFHFHPMVRYQDWETDYPALIAQLMSTFKPEEVGMVSMGTLTWIKPVIKTLRTRGVNSSLLQMEMEDAAGKLSYPMAFKKKLFSTAWRAFRPWHEKVFFYFCMEDRELWESVFGACPESNEVLEEAMLDALFGKLELDWEPDIQSANLKAVSGP